MAASGKRKGEREIYNMDGYHCINIVCQLFIPNAVQCTAATFNADDMSIIQEIFFFR